MILHSKECLGICMLKHSRDASHRGNFVETEVSKRKGIFAA
jgi:hypothetical protein